jgi:hypothetical protein
MHFFKGKKVKKRYFISKKNRFLIDNVSSAKMPETVHDLYWRHNIQHNETQYIMGISMMPLSIVSLTIMTLSITK